MLQERRVNKVQLARLAVSDLLARLILVVRLVPVALVSLRHLKDCRRPGTATRS